MKTLLKKPWFITISFALFSVGILIFLTYQNMTYYLGVFNFEWMITPLCITPIALVIISYFRPEERRQVKKLVRSVLFILPILALVLFQVNKPPYDVEAAISEIEDSSDFEDVRLNEEYSRMSFTPRANWFVSTAYVFAAKQADETVTLIFNPVTGEYNIIGR